MSEHEEIGGNGELDKQADIINRYPLSHPLSNNPSHRASIKHLLEPPQKRAMLTPLVQGKVQYGMLKKAAHFDLIREELSDRNISFSAETGWMACLGSLVPPARKQCV